MRESLAQYFAQQSATDRDVICFAIGWMREDAATTRDAKTASSLRRLADGLDDHLDRTRDRHVRERFGLSTFEPIGEVAARVVERCRLDGDS